MAKQAFKVGEAPWEKASGSPVPASFKVGEAPWEKGEEKASKTGSAVRQFAQGATANFSDELAGAFEAAGRAVGLEGAGGPVKDIKRADGGMTTDWDVLKHAYITGRERERAALAKDAKDNPGVSTAANLTGAVASPANKLAKGTSLLTGGARIAAASSAGASEADNIADLVVDTGTGMVIGAATGKVAEKAAPLVDKASEFVENGVKKVGKAAKGAAEKFAARALGAERGTIKKYGQDKIQQAGRYALDEGLVTATNSTDQKIAANEAAKARAMNARKAAYDQIDEKGVSQFSPLETAAKVEQKIVGGANRAHGDVQEVTKALDPHLENILSRGDKNISMKEAQDLVEALRRKAKFDTSRSTLQNDVAKQVYQTVRQSINEAAEKGADAVGVSGLRAVIEDANAKYSKGMVAGELLKNKSAREQGNKIIGLTDAIAGAGALGYGGSTGDWETAAGVVAGKKLLQRYGPQMAAKGLDRVAKALLNTPQLAGLAEKSPAAFTAIVAQFEKPSVVGKAAENDPKLKGPAKWTADGVAKVMEHDKEFAPESIEKLVGSKKGRQLLARASDLKPGSKAMENVVGQIKTMASDGMIEAGNINLQNRPRVKNKDGSISTVRSMGINIDGQEVLIPTVSEDGRIMSDEEAIRQYKKTGRHLGKFKSAEASTRYAERLHDDQAKLIAKGDR